MIKCSMIKTPGACELQNNEKGRRSKTQVVQGKGTLPDLLAGSEKIQEASFMTSILIDSSTEPRVLLSPDDLADGLIAPVFNLKEIDAGL
jgi:hypothetical protein